MFSARTLNLHLTSAPPRKRRPAVRFPAGKLLQHLALPHKAPNKHASLTACMRIMKPCKFWLCSIVCGTCVCVTVLVMPCLIWITAVPRPSATSLRQVLERLKITKFTTREMLGARLLVLFLLAVCANALRLEGNPAACYVQPFLRTRGRSGGARSTIYRKPRVLARGGRHPSNANRWYGATRWYGDTPYNDAPSSAELVFESSYLDKTGTPRGFCNWVVPGKIMVGRYPHGTPLGSKTGRPTPGESREV